jgi:hypothetical protein
MVEIVMLGLAYGTVFVIQIDTLYEVIPKVFVG